MSSQKRAPATEPTNPFQLSPCVAMDNTTKPDNAASFEQYPADFLSWPEPKKNEYFGLAAALYRANKTAAEKTDLSVDDRDQTLATNLVNEWPELKPLPEGLLAVEPFDIRYLPDALAPWAQDISHRMQCPLDFVGITILAALGSLIGRKVAVAPEMKGTWLVIPNQWAILVGRPGVMKSPAMSEALKPLKRLANEAAKRYAQAYKNYEKEMEIYQFEVSKAKKLAKNDSSKYRTALESLEQPIKPADKRYIVNDTTYEALGVKLAANPNGLLVERDEMVSLLCDLDRDEQAAARGLYLTGWNGDAGYTFDRITRPSEYIEGCCISLLGTTQPSRLAEYVDRANNGGKGDDGLIQRFGLMVYPDINSNWQLIDEYPDKQARDKAFETFDRLDKITPESIGAVKGEYDPLPYLRLSPAAYDLFIGYRQKLESSLRSKEFSPALESHFSKHRKLIPSLALIYHLADGGVGPVSEVAMARALAAAYYLASHARRIYASGSECETVAAKMILSHLERGDLKEGFTVRDIQRKGWSNLQKTSVIQSGLDLLADCNYITPNKAQIGPKGGRPTVSYRISPKVRW